MVSRSTSSGVSWAKVGRVGAPRARKPDRFNTVVAEEKTFPNGGWPRPGMAAAAPGKGFAPSSRTHLGSPRVLHDLVVVVGHVAHRRVSRVRRVRGGVCCTCVRGKFLTDCRDASRGCAVTVSPERNLELSDEKNNPITFNQTEHSVASLRSTKNLIRELKKPSPFGW